MLCTLAAWRRMAQIGLLSTTLQHNLHFQAGNWSLRDMVGCDVSCDGLISLHVLAISTDRLHRTGPACHFLPRWIQAAEWLSQVKLQSFHSSGFIVACTPILRSPFFLLHWFLLLTNYMLVLFFYLTSKECLFLYITSQFLVSTFKPNLSLRKCRKFPLCVRLQIFVLSFRSWCIESRTSAPSTGYQNTTPSHSIQGQY